MATPPQQAAPVKKVLLVVDWTSVTQKELEQLQELRSKFTHLLSDRSSGVSLPYPVFVEEVRLSLANSYARLLYQLAGVSFPQVIINGRQIGSTSEVLKKLEKGELIGFLQAEPANEPLSFLASISQASGINPPLDEWLPITTQPGPAKDHQLYGRFFLDDRPAHLAKPTEGKQLGWLSRAVENTNWFMNAVVSNVGGDTMDDPKVAQSAPANLASLQMDKEVVDYKGYRKNWLHLEENVVFTLTEDSIGIKDPFFEAQKAAITYSQIENIFLLPEHWLLFYVGGPQGVQKHYIQCEEESLDRFLTTLAFKAKRPLLFWVQLSRAPSTTPNKRVFKVPIDILASPPHVSVGGVPKVVEDLISHLERNGLQSEGIFRLAGVRTACQNLENAYDLGETVDLAGYGIHEMASVLKTWLRSLPNPIVPEAIVKDIIEVKETLDEEGTVRRLRELLAAKLPIWNVPVLRRLMSFLKKVAEHSDVNKMTSNNLARVFAPNVLPATNYVTLKHGEQMNQSLELMINHWDTLFPSPAPEEEDDQDDQDQEVEKTE